MRFYLGLFALFFLVASALDLSSEAASAMDKRSSSLVVSGNFTLIPTGLRRKKPKLKLKQKRKFTTTTTSTTPNPHTYYYYQGPIYFKDLFPFAFSNHSFIHPASFSLSIFISFIYIIFLTNFFFFIISRSKQDKHTIGEVD